MVSSKQCFKCERTLALTEFYRHPMMLDGYLGKCKDCTKKDVTANRNKNIEKYRKYDRERNLSPERKRAASAIVSQWRKEDSRRASAHNAVARAIKSGKLTREVCERCGASKSYAHHDDYDKKLSVMWLCQPCHKQRHKELNEAGIFP